jgi:hypothetical protein
MKSLSLAILAMMLIIGCEGAGARETRAGAWSVILSGGRGIGLSTRGVEAAMRAGGFDDPLGCMFWCSGPEDGPQSDRSGTAWQLAVRRQQREDTQLWVLIARTPLGETRGLKEGIGYSYIKQSAITCAFLVGKGGRRDRGWYVAGGPAVYRVTLQHSLRPDGPCVSTTTIGASATLGEVYPLNRRFFLDVHGQCFLAVPVKMGPLDIPYLSATLPRTSVNFTHGVLALGVGVRL